MGSMGIIGGREQAIMARMEKRTALVDLLQCLRHRCTIMSRGRHSWPVTALLIDEQGVVALERRDRPSQTCEGCGRHNFWWRPAGDTQLWAMRGSSKKMASRRKIGYRSYCPRCWKGIVAAGASQGE